MKFLTINTAGTSTAIAYYNGEEASYYYSNDGKKASEVLLCAIDGMLGETELCDVDYLACITGPGSFTGIRIGVNTVKAFCYALGKKAIAITYNKALSSVANGNSFVVVNGWADNCYVSAYDSQGNELFAPTAMTLDEAAALYSANYSGYEFIVDSAEVEQFSCFTTRVITTPEYLLGATLRAVSNGEIVAQEEVSPYYAMKSQAERDLEK